MAMGTAISPRRDPVTQFSIFTPNRLGRLKELVGGFDAQNVHVLGLMVLDTTDSGIIRLGGDDPERAREILRSGSFPFTESPVVVVEAAATDLATLMAVLLQAE